MKNRQIFNRLWVRLTLAFAVVAVIGIGLASLLANLAIDNEFRSFGGRSEATLQNSDLATKLVSYYTEHQSWDGVGTVLIPAKPPEGGGPQPGSLPPDRFSPPLSLIVADAKGQIVFDSGRRRAGEMLGPAEQDAATPLQAGEQTIGYLDFTPGPVVRRPDDRSSLGGQPATGGP